MTDQVLWWIILLFFFLILIHLIKLNWIKWSGLQMWYVFQLNQHNNEIMTLISRSHLDPTTYLFDLFTNQSCYTEETLLCLINQWFTTRTWNKPLIIIRTIQLYLMLHLQRYNLIWFINGFLFYFISGLCSFPINSNTSCLPCFHSNQPGCSVGSGAERNDRGRESRSVKAGDSALMWALRSVEDTTWS